MVAEEVKNSRQNTAIAAHDDQVYEWARGYYAIDDAAQMEEKRKEAEERFTKKCAAVKPSQKSANKPVRKTQKKPKTEKMEKAGEAAKEPKKKEDGQLSLFDAGILG